MKFENAKGQNFPSMHRLPAGTLSLVPVRPDQERPLL